VGKLLERSNPDLVRPHKSRDIPIVHGRSWAAAWLARLLLRRKLTPVSSFPTLTAIRVAWGVMDAMVNHQGRHRRSSAQPFLAADVGGTHARLALVQEARADPRTIELIAYRKLTCGDYASLVDLLRAFLKSDVAGAVGHCVLACAGQVIDDEVIHDNLTWPVSLGEVQDRLGFDALFVLNDFEALGYALADADRLGTRLLCGPDVVASGPKLVVGPGTGLGAAVHLPNGPGFVIATEAGQMDFAAQTLREREVLACLAPEGGYVPCERVLSGPGLLTLYRTLCDLNGAPPCLATPETITDAARQRTDANATEAVDLFCAALGSFVGNLAMDFMARGGVYLAGGFLSAMFDLLQRSEFATRFLHGRSIRIFLEHVPVRVMEHGQHGVLGAARYYLGGFGLDRTLRERLTK